MSVPSLTAWPPLAVRLVVALCALTLLATASIGLAEPVGAADLGAQISSGRRSQNYYVSQMQAADRQVAALKRQAKATRTAAKRARRAAKRSRRALAGAKRVVIQRRARAKDVSGAFDDPADAPKPWRYEKRLRQVRTELRIAERRKAALGARVRNTQRAARARQYRLNSLKRATGAAVYRREAAEGALGALMSRMTRLAAARVKNQSTVSLAGGSDSFSWPSTGRISQTYGCTGFHLNPRKGSCRHFHDGVDIVDSYGTAIRAAAVGVVAYAGWNPFDEGGRAWIVVVAHPDGFVTRYGHLVPSQRVRAGSLVHTGQIIGKMGSTGRSTGTHLHFELLRGGSTVSPFAYLPSGVLEIKVDKKSTKKGIAAARRKARAKARAVAKRQAVKARKRAKQAAKASPSGQAPALACDVTQGERAAGTGMLQAVAIVTDAENTAALGEGCSTEVTEDSAKADVAKSEAKPGKKANTKKRASKKSQRDSKRRATKSNAKRDKKDGAKRDKPSDAKRDEAVASSDVPSIAMPVQGQGVSVPFRGTSPIPS